MGLYPSNCQSCGDHFLWFSGSSFAQVCPKCYSPPTNTNTNLKCNCALCNSNFGFGCEASTEFIASKFKELRDALEQCVKARTEDIRGNILLKGRSVQEANREAETDGTLRQARKALGWE